MQLCYFLVFMMSVLIALTYAVDEAFFSSCRVGDVAKVKSYLEAGVSASSRDVRGNTGMIIAAGRGQNEVIKLLLSYGASVEDASSMGIFEGKNAISWACSQGRVETVALLMQAGANPEKPPTGGAFAGKNGLMWAASQGRTEVVKFLIAAGVDVDYSSDFGKFQVRTAKTFFSAFI